MSGTQQVLLAGSGGVGVLLTDKTVNGLDASGVSAGSASATFTLTASGIARAITSGNASSPPAGTTDYTPQWMIQGPSSLYECRATLQSQTGSGLSSGTLATWQAMSSDRSWNCAVSVAAGGGQVIRGAVLVLEIRLAGSLQMLVGAGGFMPGATITLKAEANSG